MGYNKGSIAMINNKFFGEGERCMYNGIVVIVSEIKYKWYDDDEIPTPNEENVSENPQWYEWIVRDENDFTNYWYCDYDDLESVRKITDLTTDELKKLRKQICIGSLYVSDCNNTLNVPAKEVSDYADCYVDYLLSLCGEGATLAQAYERDSADEFAYYIENIAA